MKTFDAAIVGAGIVGAACAAALTREGLSVAIIDADDIAAGTTAAGMGHIVVMDDSDAQFELTNYSQKLWKRLATELPADCEYEHCGTIWVAADDEEMEAVHSKHATYARHGTTAEILDEKTLRQAEPNLARDLVGGLLVNSDSVVYQLGATMFLIKKAVAKGATLLSGRKAVGIADGCVTLDKDESIKAAIIINASGAAAHELSPPLKIKKRKGHLVITERYPGFVSHQLVELGYLKSAHGSGTESVAFNVQPRITGQVLLGSSRQFDVDNDIVDRSILTKMTERAFRYMPKLRGLTGTRAWTGFRPATPDNLPYIGKIPGFNAVYAAAGHEGLGITTSLGTAELLADLIIGRPTAIAAEPYSPERNS